MVGKYTENSAQDSDTLATEQQNPSTLTLDQLNSLEIVTVMNREDASVADSIYPELPKIARAVDLIVEKFQSGGRLIYIGAGTSGRLGVLDASECPPTFNTPPWMVLGLIAGGYPALTTSAEEAEDDAGQGREDLRKVGVIEQDVVVGIAASGRTPYVLGALEYARERGASTIGICCNKNTPLEKVAELTISPASGPEVVTGSTRLKAGTAQKMVLNMLSTASMARLGKTYGNLMVDVRATNAKLRRRAVRIVCICTGLPENEAAELLEQCKGEAKVAIVAALAGISPETAKTRLEKRGGRVRAALEDKA
jgi:N-acetylmuramic acid 6-phosphate etherase